MLKNYLKIAWRNLWKSKGFTFINVFGLTVGMAACLIIGLWVFDELSANHYHTDYKRIGMVWKNSFFNNKIETTESNAIPLADKLRNEFPEDIDLAVASSFAGQRVLKNKEIAVIKRGLFMEDGGEQIVGIELTEGRPTFPMEPNDMLISESTANSLFGEENPIGQVVEIESKIQLEVKGVYADLPVNSTFRNVHFLSTMTAYANMEEWVRNSQASWKENSFPIYVKLVENADFEKVSEKVKKAVPELDGTKLELFIHPMDKWKHYNEFENGVAVGKGITTVWILAVVGFIVLLLAAVNYMNISTARSEHRSREIGIRKAVGSLRKQLVAQFYTETFLVVFGGLFLGVLLTALVLPRINQITDKEMHLLWSEPLFWLPIGLFLMVVVLLSGSYPALYLSSFEPLKVLKGRFVQQKGALFSRKSLVVFQFTISIVLIICTITLIRQLNYTQTRPLGYDRNGLIQIRKNSPNLVGHFFAMREQLLNSGAVLEMAETTSPLSESWFYSSDIDWRGKQPNLNENFVTLRVTPEFGQTIDWRVVNGRDFSRQNRADVSRVIVNETAVQKMDLKEPIGEQISIGEESYEIVGVVKDIVMDSPFEPVRPTVFTMSMANAPFITCKLNPDLPASESVSKLEEVLHQFDPGNDFNIRFADADFDVKFWREQRLLVFAKLFAGLAIIISLLGVLGLASFLAERKTKEVAVRKVLGARMLSLWSLLTGDFIKPVLLSCVFALPIGWYAMHNWLNNYSYRTHLSIWTFIFAGLGVLSITVIAVSYQAIKAAMTNPVKSLKSE